MQIVVLQRRKSNENNASIGVVFGVGKEDLMDVAGCGNVMMHMLQCRFHE